MSAHDGGDTLFVLSGARHNVDAAKEDINASIEKVNSTNPRQQQRARKERKPDNANATDVRYRSRSPLYHLPANTWQDESMTDSVWAEETMGVTRHSH